MFTPCADDQSVPECSGMLASGYRYTACSICHRRTEPVWPRGSLEEAELDQEPDRADDRDKPNQHPPAGFVTVVEALDMDDDRGDQGE